MAVIKRSNVSRNDMQTISEKEAAAERFINKTDRVEAANPSQKKKNKEPIIVRIDPDILEKIDAAAAKRGISRSAWINSACTRTLEHEND
jgi:predicted HicB family RNase H-like nuclease